MTSLLNIAGNIPVVAEAGGQSLRFEDADSPYMEWSVDADSDVKKWTLSFWVKRCELGQQYLFTQTNEDGSGADIKYFACQFTSSDELRFADRWASAGDQYITTTAKFRDPSAWYHVVLVRDSDNAIQADRAIIYVNGVRQTVTGSFTQSKETEWNRATVVSYGAEQIGRFRFAGTWYYSADFYLANVCNIDGQALDPTSFGEYDGTLWKPKADTDIQSLTFGTNGFYLPFKQTTEAEGFSTVTYTGNGGTQSIEGVGFEPDMVWTKERTSTSYHEIHDSVRGVNKQIFPNATDAEESLTKLTSFDASGFSLAAHNSINESGQSYVAWCWDAGSGSAASNTDGSITSTVKANTAKGFSIVTYSGSGTRTVGHGLGATPKLIIEKKRDATGDWLVQTTVIDGSNDYLRLNTTAAKADGVGASPTSTVFTPNVGGGANCVAYCFAEVSGYSSIGSYTGTGASGNSITGLGFKPAWLMVKRTDSTGDWAIFDNNRDVSGGGTTGKMLEANLSDAESDANNTYQFNSDGFEWLSGFTNTNASGGSYIYLAFADTRDATFFGDTSGNGNNWTPNALNNTDVVPDSPVSGGNFAVMNNIEPATSTAFSEGNLKIAATASTWNAQAGTFFVSSGKWYAEVYNVNGNGSSLRIGVGIVEESYNPVSYLGQYSDSWGWYDTGAVYNNAAVSSTESTFGAGDILGIALDLDTNTVSFYKNGTLDFSKSISAGNWAIATSSYASGSSAIINFGQDSSFAGNITAGGNTDDNGVGDFYYAPPSGFLALTTGNLPTPTITAPDEYFNTLLWTGDGTSSRALTNVGFRPDWVWIKARSLAYNHQLLDSVRGAGTSSDSKSLVSNNAEAESWSSAAFGFLSSFDSDGFTFTAGSTNNDQNNASGSTYVAWNWLAGNGTVSNTDGSITSTVSSNQTAGFSILTFTEPSSGTFSVGHGLSQSPEMIFIKRRDGAESWVVWHKDLATPPTTSAVYLNGTDALTNSGSTWLNSVTSSVVQYTSGQFTTGNTAKVMYAFHSVDGYSKVGSYTGNGSTDGTYVHCGFRPAFVMVKRTDGANNWLIQHNKSLGYNPSNSELYANLTNAEATADRADFLSNGFKARINSTENNGSGASYIFIAFAEAPFKSANAR